MAGAEHIIQAKGMNSLSKASPAPDVKNLIKHFPNAEQGTKAVFDRKHSQVQVMLGMTSRLLQCMDGLAAGNPRLNKTVF